MRLSTATIALCVLSFAGCRFGGNKYDEDWSGRFGAEPQYYDIKEIKTGFNTPNISNRWNIGLYGGVDRSLYRTEKTRFKAGVDLRLNYDVLDDNRSNSPNDFNDCITHGDVSMVTQDALTPIPFIGLEQRIGKFDFLLEVGFPYSTWKVEAGNTTGPGCFENVQSARASDWGQKVRLGFVRHPDRGPSLGGYVTYERYDNSVIEVDLWGFEFSVDF